MADLAPPLFSREAGRSLWLRGEKCFLIWLSYECGGFESFSSLRPLVDFHQQWRNGSRRHGRCVALSSLSIREFLIRARSTKVMWLADVHASPDWLADDAAVLRMLTHSGKNCSA